MNNFESMKKKQIELIKKDELISKFIKHYKFDDEFINDNFNIFNNCYTSIEMCKKCTGLNTCPQAKQGEFVGLTYNGLLNNNMVCCNKEIKKQEVIRHANSFVYSDIPMVHSTVNLDNITVKESSLKQLYVMAYKILEGKTNKGLYIYGDLGVGKTYMSIALANSLVDKGYKVSFIKLNDFVNKMFEYIKDDTVEYESVLDRVKKSDYLFVDDIGAENVTEFTRDRLLYNILDYRMENKLCTIFTSNFDKKSLAKHFSSQDDISSKRLMERIDILTEDYCLTGKNKRRETI